MAPLQHPRASWPSGDDDAGFNLIVILLGICLGSYLLWTHYHAAISAFVMAVMHHEILVIDRFTHRYAAADREMRALAPGGVTLRQLLGIVRAVGLFFRIPATAFILALAVVCTVWAPPSRFRRAFDLEGLIREQAASFPVTAAFVGRALALKPPAESVPRPADYALTVEEWIERYALNGRKEFDEARARTALVAQLGAPWAGPEEAAPVARFLFVVFGLHLAERRDEALALLGAASSALPKAAREGDTGPDVPLILPAGIIAQAERLLRDREAFQRARDAAGCHAYTTTALMGLLNAARMKAGVLAPGQFAWLKLVDRSLWYALHSLGVESEGIGLYLHPNPRVEAAAARDHWALEQVAGAPVMKPGVERALDVVRRAVPVPEKPTDRRAGLSPSSGASDEDAG